MIYMNADRPLVIVMDDEDGSFLLYRQGAPRSAVAIYPDEIERLRTALTTLEGIA